MLKLTCLCGQARLDVNARPEFLNECNCAFCSKSGAAWGYFHPSEVSVEGSSKGYVRTDKKNPVAEVRFCPACGSTTHFVLTPEGAAKFGNSIMGVNMRLADERDLAGIELRYPDGQTWDGAGEISYLREPRILGR